jgi:hypothetical protein
MSCSRLRILLGCFPEVVRGGKLLLLVRNLRVYRTQSVEAISHHLWDVSIVMYRFCEWIEADGGVGEEG